MTTAIYTPAYDLKIDHAVVDAKGCQAGLLKLTVNQVLFHYASAFPSHPDCK